MGVFPEKQATILLSDMIGFTRRTMKMVPKNADRSALLDYIALKNKSIEYRHGNRKKDVSPDFPKARQTLKQACGVYEGITDRPDLSSERIMEWFWERAPRPRILHLRGSRWRIKADFPPIGNPMTPFFTGPFLQWRLFLMVSRSRCGRCQKGWRLTPNGLRVKMGTKPNTSWKIRLSPGWGGQIGG